MKRRLTAVIAFTCAVLLSAPLVAQQRRPIAVPLTFDDYYTYDQLVEALQALHRAFPQLTRLDVAASSDEGRAIYAMTVNNPKTGAELDKPGIYVDGNIHGNEIQAGEVCLYLLNYLLSEYGRNDEITRLVDRVCFYVVPSVNVDGRAHFFTDANDPDSSRSLRIPHDDDGDGLVDEDFSKDLDGDGNICMMRKRDPFGSYKTDPEEPRLLVRIKPGEKGEWTILGPEGVDADGDGKIGEDGEGYLDGNRNWGYDWQPAYVETGAGEYPFQGRGLRGLAAYICARPNISMAWAFHNFGGMILRGPSSKNEPAYPSADIAVYDYLGQQTERITPGYRYMVSWKDLYQTHGDFSEWMAMSIGAFSFVGELYMNKQEAFKSRSEEKTTLATGAKENPEESGGFFGDNNDFTRERLRFSDHLTQGELYRPWKPFKHPLYGDIEIGGWVKMSSRLPPPFLLGDLAHRNAAAVIFSAKQAPDIRLDVFEVRKIGSNLYRLRVRLTNSTAIPTMSQHAEKVRLYPQDMLTVVGSDARVVAGGRLNNSHMDDVGYRKFRPELQFLSVPGFGKAEFQFLIAGSGDVEVTYRSRHGGTRHAKATLK